MVGSQIYNTLDYIIENISFTNYKTGAFFTGNFNNDMCVNFTIFNISENIDYMAFYKNLFEEMFDIFKFKELKSPILKQTNNVYLSILANYIYYAIICFGLIIQIFMLFLKHIVNFFSHSLTQFILKKLKNQMEQNIGTFEDLYFILILFFSIFFFNFFYFFNFNIFKMFTYVFSITLYFVILIPLRIVFFMGASFMVFIKGSSIYKKLFIELLYDITGYLAFFMRFLLQCVRILLLFVFYFLLHEYVFEMPKHFLTDYANSFITHTSGNLFLSITLIVR